MALVGSELLIVVGVLLVVFLWGPQKLPELAKSIGVAKREFEQASKEAPQAETSPEPLIVAATSMGVATEGKTRERLIKEISEK